MYIKRQISVLFVFLYIVQSQAQSGTNWWDEISETAPPIVTTTEKAANVDYYDDNYDGNGIDEVCCECVPLYLCGDDNRIVVDGGDIIGPRFGDSIPVTNVEICPDVTQLCCRVPTASPNCAIPKDTTRGVVAKPNNTPCECINWDFCPENYRISDGTPSTTHIEIEGAPLPGHSKCPNSLEVCCAFEDEPIVDPGFTTSPAHNSNDCVCVNPQLCGEDGVIITAGVGLINLRTSSPRNDGTCLASDVCCKEPDVVTIIKAKTTNIPIISDKSCNGIRNSNGIAVRISGFDQGESQFGEFPWVGLILRTYFVADQPMNAFIGGATLIHPRVMLTAAHKVINEEVLSLSVRIGEWDLETEHEPGKHQVRLVKSVVIHPQFDKKTLYHDVALLILSEPLEYQSHIRSICLADSVADVDTSNCVINGWGKDNYDSGNYQTIMKSITLPLVRNRLCQAQLRRTRLGRWFQLHSSFVCAGGEKGKDACSSDGGGPLACPVKGSTSGEYLLVGVTAWGIGCGEENVPGVYASVMEDKRWITNEVDNLFPGHTSLSRRARSVESTFGKLNKTCNPVNNNCESAPTTTTIKSTTPTTTPVTKNNSNTTIQIANSTETYNLSSNVQETQDKTSSVIAIETTTTIVPESTTTTSKSVKGRKNRPRKINRMRRVGGRNRLRRRGGMPFGWFDN